ncbi:MAG: hypothetical protein JST79_12075 [Acidobacteria bacterium]|jgi:hypothetical protein|nr:hypothetical protein [Acidobacteriota bacterium]
MTQRIQFIEHAGQKVLLLDFSHATRQQMILLLEEIQLTVTQQPRNSVLVLADFTEAPVDKSIATKIKEVLVFDRPHVKRAAWIGTEGLPKVFYENFKSFSQREFPTFKTREEAMDFLVKE